MPTWQPPMLAALTADAPADDGWLVERKLDGVRCLASRDAGRVRLRSRTDRPLDGAYPEIAGALAAQPMSRFLLDGEVVAFDGARTSFQRLHGRLGLTDPRAARATGIEVFYYVFDLLHLDGHDTTALPLTDRRALLREAFAFSGPLRLSPDEPGSRAPDLFAEACARGEEGVVLKRADSTYRGGRSGEWLKHKCVRDQELIVGGWTPGQGGRRGLGALLVGHHDGPDLAYAGKVGTGFDDRALADLGARLARLAADVSPFTRGRPTDREVHWVRPELVVQVGFSEWTTAGRLRHPRYQGLREDKAAADVVREQ